MKESESHLGGGVERDGNVARLVRPEGTYSIIYGVHVLPMDPNDIPAGLDFITFETPIILPGSRFSWTVSPENSLYDLRSRGQTSPLFGELAQNRTPIVFADTTLDISRIDLDFRDVGLFTLEGAAGVLCAAPFVDSIDEILSRPISRRHFLKYGGLALASYFMLPAVAITATFLTAFTGVVNEPLSEFEKFVYEIHPEIFFLSSKLRNTILAHKQNWLMKKLGAKHSGTVIGAAHKGLEVELEATAEERIAFLKKTQRFWYHAISPEAFHKIVVMKFEGDNWVFSETYEVPELRELAYQE